MNEIERRNLISAAQAAALNAYAPYSHFRVGAAVATEKGIFLGANIENASYGLTVCAERTALFNAVSSGAKSIIALAVACIDASPSAGTLEKMPCGACRQVALELLSPDAEIHVYGVEQVFRLSDLLPNPFQLPSAK